VLRGDAVEVGEVDAVWRIGAESNPPVKRSKRLNHITHYDSK
jgi:hypothetical protein